MARSMTNPSSESLASSTLESISLPETTSDLTDFSGQRSLDQIRSDLLRPHRSRALSALSIGKRKRDRYMSTYEQLPPISSKTSHRRTRSNLSVSSIGNSEACKRLEKGANTGTGKSRGEKRTKAGSGTGKPRGGHHKAMMWSHYNKGRKKSIVHRICDAISKRKYHFHA